MYNFEETFNCKREMDLLEIEFDKFCKTKKGITGRNIEETLRLIKLFLVKKHPKRVEFFSKTKLKHADCITRSIISQMLAKRKGYDVQIGHPKQIGKYFHSFLIYKTRSGKSNIYEIAGGKTPSKNPQSLTQKAVIRHFKLTRPFLNLVGSNTIKRKK